MLELLTLYKHYWIWPILIALGLFALIALTGSQENATPYIYNLN